MKKRFFVILLLLIITATITRSQSIINHASITFKIKNLGIYTNGTIGGLESDIHFNPADLTTSTINASIDVNTINTDNSSRDEHLKSDAFFDVSKYPKISLKSVSFKHRSGNNFTGIFNLAIKDKTKPVEIPFTYTEKGNTIIFNGSFKLNRLDFGVGSNSMIMSNEVTVSINAEGVK